MNKTARLIAATGLTIGLVTGGAATANAAPVHAGGAVLIKARAEADCAGYSGFAEGSLVRKGIRYTNYIACLNGWIPAKKSSRDRPGGGSF